MLKKLFLLFVLWSFIGCKKEHDRPQWDIEILGPLLQASIGMAQLVGDSSIITNSDGAQILNYDTLISAFEIDSIYEIADTTIPTVVIFPAFPSPINPNTPFYSNNNTINLGVGDLQLKQAIIQSGKIRLSIKNTLKSKIFFTYTIPRAKKDGLAFTVNASVDSGSTSDPKFFTGEYDFTGYDIDLTGVTGNLTNSITYNVEARSDPNGVVFNVAALDTMVNLKTTLVDISPSFVKGYLGQANTHDLRIENIGVGGLIKNGTILLDSVKMNLDIINYIGADAQANISFMRSVNNRTGNTVNLNASSAINHYLNINRAYIDPSLSDSLVPTVYSIQLDRNNSNFKSLLENIPDKIEYDIDLNINPLGNISGSNDFVFSNRLLDTRLQIQMPLSFGLNQLVLADTLPFSINNATNFDPVGPITLTLIADNGFPFDMNLQLFLIDSTQSIVDSLLIPDYIVAAPYDAAYRATGISRSIIPIQFDESRKKKLLSVKNVGVKIRFNTPDYPQLIQFYSNYRIDIKLVADGTYSIR